MKVYVVAGESSHSYEHSCGSFHVGRRPVKGKIEILLRSTGVDLLINSNRLTHSPTRADQSVTTLTSGASCWERRQKESQ